MLKRTLIAALLMLVAALSCAANPKPAPDPAIGSYFWFVALNQRCETTDPARDAALARFRTHFLDNGKRIAASLPAASATGFLNALNDMEKNGPPKESMDRVNAILAQVSPAETRQLCQRAAADIDDRIGIENRLAQAQSSVWRGEDGKPIAETKSMKSQSDFAGSMLLTTDEDWQEKWNTPPERTQIAALLQVPAQAQHGKRLGADGAVFNEVDHANQPVAAGIVGAVIGDHPSGQII